jgi:uncharacterized repeat protein (TIGR01451 family)
MEAVLARIFARLLPLILLCHFLPASADAQQPNNPPNLNLGDAVVTGFSGTIGPDPAKPRPASKSAVDLTFINPDGPSARIVDIGRPGFVWDGRLLPTPRTFDVFAKDVGQVFGVALDDQPAPNIYLAATSAFGLNLVGRGAGGQPERRKVGGPGTGWMKGQFGLDLQGDPGSIYKVDGATGVVSLFAKVMLDGVPNPGPALGNLAYDAAHKQLFVSDLYTGMIHRFAIADGSESGAPYDHGVTARGSANLAPMPFNPANRPNIASTSFNSENPDSWGFAPPERRVWGIAVKAGRLFYSARNGSAAEGPQIWSVGIAQDGSFATDASLEIEVAAEPGPYPVSDIAFSQRGAMILAQRAPIAASYDYSAFTKPGEPRVLRYWLKDANDPPSPGLWKPMPEEYAVGFAGTYRNTDGGVALGYGYGPDGMINTGTCDAALWTTGQNLRNNPALRSQLEPGGPLVVNGLQGSPADMVRSANEPPAVSYFIDYDDKFDDPSASGHMGSVRILATPCAGQVADSGRSGYSSSSPPYVSGPQTPPPTTPGCVGPNCMPCQFGTYPDGSCKPPIDLAIKKTAGEAMFDEKTGVWTIQFTVIVTNAGAPFSPGGFINIADPVPAGLTVTSATGTGWSPCTGNLLCGYNYGPGVFNTGATLPPLVITVTTKTPGKYENCAVVGLPPSSGFHETKLPNNKDCATVELKYPPNKVTIAKVSPTEPCAVESTCTFKIVVTNSSPWPFNGPVTIGDNAGLPMNISSTDLPCNPVPTAIPFTCTAGVSLPAGVSSATYTIVGVIPAGAIPLTSVTEKNCAVITQAPPIPGFPSTIVVPPGPDCKPYTACGFACHMTQQQIDQIKIDKKANAAECSPGGLCSYTFTITNLSTTAATSTFPIAFVDTMPAGAATFVPPPVPAPWTCLPLGGNPDKIKCLYPPSSIPAGGHLTVVVTFQISPNYTEPTLQNCSEFFIGQTAMAAAQRRSESAMDASTLRTYLQSRGIAALPAAMTTPVLGPNDKSCTTVKIANPGGIKPCPPGTVLVGKECVKPHTCPPPLVIGPADQCMCPQGTVLVGKECVKQTTCAPPMIPGPVSGQCICPPGTVQSGKECVKPHTCLPPLVMGPADQCVCPQGTVLVGKECVKPHTCLPPMIPGPTDQCICPPGTVLKGKECVKFKPIECRSPLIPNAAGTDCVCRPGLVQKGRRCVEPVVCKPPATLNRRGECQCPQDMVAKGNSCVERERRTPTISPDDVIRNIPGGGRGPRGGRDPEPPRGGGYGAGGHTEPPRGGGRDNDPPRGGGRDNDPPRGGQGMDLPGRR